MKKDSKQLKKELEKAELDETKKMWKNVNSFWKFIIVLGCVALVYLTYLLGLFIGNLI